MKMMGWIGLAALGAMQYMGPRPLFVKTAYAAPVETVEVAWTAPQDVMEFPALDHVSDRPANRMND